MAGSAAARASRDGVGGPADQPALEDLVEMAVGADEERDAKNVERSPIG